MENTSPYFTKGIQLTPPLKTPSLSPILNASSAPVARISPQDMAALQGIKLHSTVVNDGIASISDNQGNRQWVKAGRNINGWNLHSIDKTGTKVIFEKNGAFVPVGLQGAVISEYKPPIDNVESYSLMQDPTGTIIEDKESIVGAGPLSDFEQKNINSYNFEPDVFEKIVKNSQKSPHMSADDKKRIMTRDSYLKEAEKGENSTLEKGKNYFIPRKLDDGSVDFDIFTPQSEIN